MIVTGQIVDKVTGQPLVGATIAATDVTGKPIPRSTGGVIGTTSNQSGFFDLFDAPEGQYLTISYVGYQSIYTPVQKDVFIELQPGVDLPEATVTGKKTGSNIGWWLLALLGMKWGYNKLKGGTNG